MSLYSNLVFVACCFLGCCAGAEVDPIPGSFRTIQTGPKVLWNETTLDKLKKDLFMNYDKYARPEQHFNTTEVSLGIAITHIETDELKSTFTFHGMLRMIWKDPKLKWNEDDYSGVDVTRIADHEIWQPDIYLYNSASGGEPIVRFGNPNVLVYPNGEVLWVPPTKLTALCELNLRHWPFDTQHCFLRFGSWTHNGNEIKLKLYNNRPYAEFEPTISYSAWNVSNTTAEVVAKYYDCCTEPYYYVEFNLTLARKSDTYKAVIVTPAVVNALLILMQFWLPPQAQEKLILNGFVAVVLIMFLIFFTSQVSAAGANTPLIVLFYSCSLYMLCFAMITNVASFWLSKSTKTQSLIWRIKKHLRGRFGKWLFLELKFVETCLAHRPASARVMEFGGKNYRAIKFSSSDCTHHQECILAVIVNRILFVIYSLIFLIFSFVYLL